MLSRSGRITLAALNVAHAAVFVGAMASDRSDAAYLRDSAPLRWNFSSDGG